ncbi:hypothetical protein [Streptomyces noursei]
MMNESEIASYKQLSDFFNQQMSQLDYLKSVIDSLANGGRTATRAIGEVRKIINSQREGNRPNSDSMQIVASIIARSGVDGCSNPDFGEHSPYTTLGNPHTTSPCRPGWETVTTADLRTADMIRWESSSRRTVRTRRISEVRPSSDYPGLISVLLEPNSCMADTWPPTQPWMRRLN